MRILAIDPGCTESAVVIIENLRPVDISIKPNDEILEWLAYTSPDLAVIEQVASYGMAVGAEVFDTVWWAGRFFQELWRAGIDTRMVKRLPVKLHLCHDSKAKDSNIIQALVDRFAYGLPNRGKGTVRAPGWFFGFKDDIWQAYALAVLAADEATGAAA